MHATVNQALGFCLSSQTAFSIDRLRCFALHACSFAATAAATAATAAATAAITAHR